MNIKLTQEGCTGSCEHSLSCKRYGSFKEGLIFKANMYATKPREAHWCSQLGGGSLSSAQIRDRLGYTVKLACGTLYWIPKFMTEKILKIPEEEKERNAALEALRKL